MSALKRLLVVVDMQHDFVDGALGSPAAEAIVPAVKALIDDESADGGTIVYTQDTHDASYASTQEGRRLPVPHCVRGTRGWHIVPQLVRSGARVFEKGTFADLALARYAAQFDRITICGVCTDICVVSNALLIKAFAPEAEVCVAAGACAGSSPEAHAAALVTMRSCQIDIV